MMQQILARTEGAIALDGISSKSLDNLRRILAWAAFVFVALSVVLFGVATLQVYGSGLDIGDGDSVNAGPDSYLKVAKDVLEAVGVHNVRSQSVTKVFKLRYLDAKLKCFSESGRWVYDPTPRDVAWNYIGDPFAEQCDLAHLATKAGNIYGDPADEIAARGDSANWTVRETLKWVWKTNDSCPWQSFNRDELCRMIGPNRHVMLVGDSLNHEISWSMINALLHGNKSSNANFQPDENLRPRYRFLEGPYEMCDDILGTGNAFNFSFVRNDRLSEVTEIQPVRNNFIELPWVTLLRERGIKFLLLNRGAHYEDDTLYANALRKIYTMLSLDFPDIIVIFRNTQPGHFGCEALKEPYASLPPSDNPVYLSAYHWGDFERQNAIARAITEDFAYIYMDSHAMLSLRPDGHIGAADCLHYCIPGPLDIVTEYMYNIVSLVRDLENV